MPEDLSQSGDKDPTMAPIGAVAETMDVHLQQDGRPISGQAGVGAEQVEVPGFPFSDLAISNIRLHRNDQGLSARQLSELCDQVAEGMGAVNRLSRERLSKLENGLTSNLSVDELVIVSRALGVSVSTLLGEAALSPPEQEAVERLRGARTLLEDIVRHWPHSLTPPGAGNTDT